jgi:AbrB family looped-hinge helix DNA binding protein
MIGPKGKYAWMVKVGEKGQFVIPKEARDIFGIKPGDTLLVLGDENRGIAIPPQNIFTKLAEQIFPDGGAEEEE